MTGKAETNGVTKEMRICLEANRRGRLSTGQWLDIVTEPLTPALLLMLPAIVVFGPRLLSLLRWLPVIILLVIALIIVPLVFRARRYARGALRFAVLETRSGLSPRWMFWKRPEFTASDGKTLRFAKRLVSHMPLQRGRAYLVYYLDDPGGLVLLSLVTADHPDSERWRPSEDFKRRGGVIVP